MNTTADHGPTAPPNAPRMSVAASVSRNTLFGFLNNLVQVGTRLVTVPIVIQHLGMGGYGIWNIIMMTATYMRFGSVGIKTAFQKYVAEATGTGDYERASTLLSTGCAVMVVLSVVALIPASLLSQHIARAAGVPPEFMGSAAGAISLLAVIMMMSNVGAAFEAIVMGGHRIDLVRKFSTACTVAEAVVIIVILRFGLGLFAMAAVMGISELIYIIACYIASARVVPEIRIAPEYVTKQVVYELFRFAGSFQLVNYLEVLYGSIVPIAVLRGFGAESSGVYAVVTRVVTCASVLLSAFGPSLVSGGTMVYASADKLRMHRLLRKSYRMIFAMTLLPMSFAAMFGPTLAYAWTGSADPRFHVAFWLVCVSSAFQSISGISLVLYRVAGRTLLDNVRQVLRIVVLLLIVLFAAKLGFSGTLAGLAIAEFVGMAFMLFALKRTFEMFTVSSLFPDVARVVAAAIIIVGVGILTAQIPTAGDVGGRSLAIVQLVKIAVGCALVTWPALTLTGAINSDERQLLISPLLRRQH